MNHIKTEETPKVSAAETGGLFDGSTTVDSPESGVTLDPDDPDSKLGEASDGRTTRAQKRREQRRLELLESAKTVFRTHGYHDASVHHIIEHAAVARGTFYLYFRSKQDVFRDLVEQFLGLIRASIQPITLTADSAPPLEQLRQNFQRVVQVVIDHEDLASIMLRDLTAFDGESRDTLNRFFSRVRAILERSLALGQQLGLIRDCDIHIAAVVGLGGCRQALREVLVARANDDSNSSFLEPLHVANELMRFFLEGLQTKLTPSTLPTGDSS